MFSEDGGLVWAAHYRTWGAIKQVWQADNDNEAYHAPNPSPASLMRGSLAISYDSVAEQSAHEAALNCPIRFQGQWEDAESGLYYNRHRYYDPLVGQYMSPDPLGIAGGLRPNAYVHNPHTYIDPLGLAKRKGCCFPNLPQEARDKIPQDWNETANKKGVGSRFTDPNNKGNRIRIDQGDINNTQASQQVDHVIISSGGKILGRDGKPISGSIASDFNNSHIPLNEWKGWRTWNAP